MAMDFTKSKNADTLKKIQQKSLENANKITAMDLPLSMIDENPDNEKIFNMREIEHLANTIDKVGFSGAVEVYKKGDGRYELSSGHRRFRAMKLLGRPTIPVIVKEMPDDSTRYRKLLGSNAENRKLTPMDMARAISFYKENREKEGDATVSDITSEAAEFFNISKVQVFRYLSLLQLIPELQEMADDERFPFSAFQEAASSLNKEGQKELYRQLARYIDTSNEDETELKLTRSRIQLIIESIRQNDEYLSHPGSRWKRTNKMPDGILPAANVEATYVAESVSPALSSISEPAAASAAEMKEAGLESLEDAFGNEDDAYGFASEETEQEDPLAGIVVDKNLAEEGSAKDNRKDISASLIGAVNNITELMDMNYDVKNPAVVEECITKLEDVINRLKGILSNA